MSIKSCHPIPKDREGDTATSGPTNTRQDTPWAQFKVPTEVVDRSTRRLGTFGLLSAVAHLAFFAGFRSILPAAIQQQFPPPPSFFYAMWLAVALGVAIFVLAFSKKVAHALVLDIGLIFEVVVAFLIGLMQASRFPQDILVQTGIPGLPLWVTFFVLFVPNSSGKTVLAALMSVLMGPVSLVVASYAYHQPAPPLYLFFVIGFPALMAAGFALALTRLNYKLGREVSKAHEMGSYELIELLGRGGMGEVWRAQHRLIARPAAIKLIQPEVLGCSDPKETAIVKRRFEREARATAMLTSPHTISLYDFGLTEDGSFYYVMELLRGVDLATLVDKYGPVSADRASHFLIQMCASLEEAHRSGLVHRDIKPANIYACHYGLEYDFVKVLDFGVVKSTADSAQRTQVTSTLSTTGTPGFMAPEIALGVKEIDGRADIYSVGCVGYWLLTGRLVFEEETFVATLLAHTQKIPIRPSRRTEIPVPPALEELIMACLEKDPEQRPTSAAELSRALSQAALADSWTAERAEKWWAVHMPEQTGSGSETSQQPFQSNVQVH